MNWSWLLICFRSSEEDHIWIPSCRSGLHQNSIQQRRDFRTFNKYVWWKDRILALWILHIFFEQFKKVQVILWEILYTTSICLKLWCKIIGWKYITWLLSIYYTLTNFHAKYRKLNTTYLQYYLYFFISLKQPVILPKTASPVWVRMTTSTASGVRKLEDVPMALIGCDKNGEIKAAKFRYTAGYFCVVILVFVIVF